MISQNIHLFCYSRTGFARAPIRARNADGVEDRHRRHDAGHIEPDTAIVNTRQPVVPVA